MQTYYAIVNPQTNKLIEFSEFPKDNEKIVVTGSNSEGKYTVTHLTALCVGPFEYDLNLFQKTYNPETKQFE